MVRRRPAGSPSFDHAIEIIDKIGAKFFSRFRHLSTPIAIFEADFHSLAPSTTAAKSTVTDRIRQAPQRAPGHHRVARWNRSLHGAARPIESQSAASLQ
jgi:hypothetical protein